MKRHYENHVLLKSADWFYDPRWHDKYDLYAWEDVPEYETLIPKDIDKTKYWWNKSAEQGNRSAKDALQKIYN